MFFIIDIKLKGADDLKCEKCDYFIIKKDKHRGGNPTRRGGRGKTRTIKYLGKGKCILGMGKRIERGCE